MPTLLSIGVTRTMETPGDLFLQHPVERGRKPCLAVIGRRRREPCAASHRINGLNHPRRRRRSSASPAPHQPDDTQAFHSRRQLPGALTVREKVRQSRLHFHILCVRSVRSIRLVGFLAVFLRASGDKGGASSVVGGLIISTFGYILSYSFRWTNRTRAFSICLSI
jgi:hypothetical protein